MVCSSDARSGLAWRGWREGGCSVGRSRWWQDRRRLGVRHHRPCQFGGAVLGWCVHRAEAMHSCRADHADKTTAVQVVAVGGTQSVPRYSRIEYSSGN
jgi:hypothetical protein